MSKFFNILLFIFLFISLACFASADSYPGTQRRQKLQAIDNSLDMIEQRQEKIVKRHLKEDEQNRQEYLQKVNRQDSRENLAERAAVTKIYRPPQERTPTPGKKNKPPRKKDGTAREYDPESRFEAGLEHSYIRYTEPNIMKEKGRMTGLFAVYTYKRSDNDHIKKLEDLDRYDNWPNFYRVDGKVSWGQVDYDSQGTGSLDDVDDTMAEARAVAGYDLPIFAEVDFAPYVGLGYRYLYDDLRGTTTSGATGFRRKSNYFYAPIGFDIEQRLKKGWALGINVEYDHLLYGKQKSLLGDVDPGFTTVTNGQSDGYGLRGSFKIINVSDMWDVYFEPFVRYWNINDSDTSPVIFNGTPIGAGLEPSNTSTEYGFKVGARF